MDMASVYNERCGFEIIFDELKNVFFFFILQPSGAELGVGLNTAVGGAEHRLSAARAFHQQI